jgi:alpha-mannosidase
MTLNRIINLLPCHSLDDFPVHESGDRAASLLASWTAAWHPVLINQTNKAPTWERVDQPSENLDGHLVLIPIGAVDQVPTGFFKRAKEQGALVISGEISREKICSNIRQSIKPLLPHAEELFERIDGEVVGDFYALGFAYLQIQLLTRHLRYSSTLDEGYFEQKLVEAAKAACVANMEACQNDIVSCHDLLAEERNRYFPVQPMLIDLLLATESTFGAGFEKQIGRDHPVHLLLTGQLLKELNSKQPEALTSIRDAVKSGKVLPTGGSQFELPGSMLSPESLYVDLLVGRELFQSFLETTPTLFGRRTSGFTPVFPQLLDGFGYKVTTHFSLDSGRMPSSASPRIMWEGSDEAQIAADTNQPLDASDEASFLKLGVKLGEAIDSAHWASATFAHWSNRASFCFDDLSRLHRFPATIGSFVSWNDWLGQASSPGYPDHFSADDYFEPVLKRSMIQRHQNPVSRWISYWRDVVALRAANILAVIEQLIKKSPPKNSDNADHIAGRLSALHGPLLEIQWQDNPDSCNKFVIESAERMVSALPNSAENEIGRIVLNPLGGTHRCLVHTTTAQGGFASSKATYVSDSDSNGHWTVVDVPAGGFTCLRHGEPGKSQAPSNSPRIVDEQTLRNEFFEAVVDGQSGGLRSIHLYDQRANLLSQKLSLRLPSGRQSRQSELEAGDYCRMVCDGLKTTIDNRVVGEIQTSGRIIDGDEPVAEYQQTFRVIRGSRVIHVAVDLNVLKPPTNLPWESYYCSRLAWHDESATLKRSFNETRHEAHSQKLTAPNYIDIETSDFRLSILTGGIPFHHRIGQRMLDTLLVVSGETQRHFEFGIGVNVPDPQFAAYSFSIPVIELESVMKSPEHAWLFRCEPKNLVVTGAEFDPANPRALRLRLQETQCKSGAARISMSRNIISARRINFLGEEMSPIKINNGAAEFSFIAQDFIQIELQLS